MVGCLEVLQRQLQEPNQLPRAEDPRLPKRSQNIKPKTRTLKGSATNAKTNLYQEQTIIIKTKTPCGFSQGVFYD